MPWRYRLCAKVLGLTVVPRLHVQRGDELMRVPISEPAVSRTLSLFTRRNYTLTAAEADLRGLVLAQIHTRLSEAILKAPSRRTLSLGQAVLPMNLHNRQKQFQFICAMRRACLSQANLLTGLNRFRSRPTLETAR